MINSTGQWTTPSIDSTIGVTACMLKDTMEKKKKTIPQLRIMERTTISAKLKEPFGDKKMKKTTPGTSMLTGLQTKKGNVSMPLSTGSSSTTKELKNTKNSEVVRRPTQQVCGVCEVKLRNDEPVCKRWKCEYYYASERAAYWLHRSGVARTHLNYSSEKHVDGDGVGQLTMACKCCDKLISNGCGQERCDVLCPWCVCDTRLCRNRIYKQFQWYALPRRCFARGCDVIISGEVLSVFGTDKTAVSLTDSDGQEFVACGECRSGDHPEVYCKEHGAHYYHSWDSWLPDKKRKRATPIKKTRRKAKKAAIETVVRLAPVTMPAMVVPNIPNFLDHMQISPPTPTPDPSFECLFDNVDIDHLSNDLDLDIFSNV